MMASHYYFGGFSIKSHKIVYFDMVTHSIGFFYLQNYCPIKQFNQYRCFSGQIAAHYSVAIYSIKKTMSTEK